MGRLHGYCKAALDYNDAGVANAADNFQFKASQAYNFSASGIVYTN